MSFVFFSRTKIGTNIFFDLMHFEKHEFPLTDIAVINMSLKPHNHHHHRTCFVIINLSAICIVLLYYFSQHYLQRWNTYTSNVMWSKMKFCRHYVHVKSLKALFSKKKRENISWSNIWTKYKSREHQCIIQKTSRISEVYDFNMIMIVPTKVFVCTSESLILRNWTRPRFYSHSQTWDDDSSLIGRSGV